MGMSVYLCKVACSRGIKCYPRGVDVFAPMDDPETGLISRGALDWMRSYLKEGACTSVDEGANTIDAIADALCRRLGSVLSDCLAKEPVDVDVQGLFAVYADLAKLPVLIAADTPVDRSQFLSLDSDPGSSKFELDGLIETRGYADTLLTVYCQAIAEVRASRVVATETGDADRLRHHLDLCFDSLGLLWHTALMYSCERGKKVDPPVADEEPVRTDPGQAE